MSGKALLQFFDLWQGYSKAMSPSGSKLSTLLACLIALLAVDASHSTVFAEVITLGAPANGLDPGVLVRRAIALAAANKAAEADDAYRAAVNAAERPGSDAKGLADILYWQTVFLRDQHRFDEASAAAERAIRIYQEKLGPNSAPTAIMHGLLGSIALWQYQPSKAEPHFRAVLEAYSSRPAEEFEIVAATATKELAILERNRSRFSDAEELMKQAIAIREHGAQLDETALAYDLEFLGLIYIDEGRFAEAETVARRSLEINQKVFGSENVRVSNPLTVLGLASQAAGHYADAENSFKQALALREKNAPSDVFTLDTLLIHLGTNYRMQSRFAEAEPPLRRALAIREARLKPNDPQIADGLFSLAALYRAQQRYSEAEPLFRRSLEDS